MLSNWVFSIRPMAFRASCPWYFSSIGLWSKLSTCDTAPSMNRKITLRALGR